MHALEFIPGAFCGLAIVDGSLKLIGNSETDNTKCFFILFILLFDLLQQLVLLSLREGDLILICPLYCFDINGFSMLTADNLPNSLFRNEHSTLEGLRMVCVVAEFLDAIAASVRIFGEIVCHRLERTIAWLNEWIY